MANLCATRTSADGWRRGHSPDTNGRTALTEPCGLSYQLVAATLEAKPLPPPLGDPRRRGLRLAWGTRGPRFNPGAPIERPPLPGVFRCPSGQREAQKVSGKSADPDLPAPVFRPGAACGRPARVRFVVWHATANERPRRGQSGVWDGARRLTPHLPSLFCSLRRGPSFLINVVRFDVPRLGTSRSRLCAPAIPHRHRYGLAHRLGAPMTGLDLSQPALAEARRLAASPNVEATFLVRSLTTRPSSLGEGRFDLVFAGVGALIWLPDTAAGNRSSPTCCDQAEGYSCEKAPRSCGLSPTQRTRTASSS